MQKAKIVVAVRKRPLFQKEKAKGYNDIVTVNGTSQIYDYIISPLIDSAFEGAKVSCFAYGQTGSGKTHTMNGVMSKGMPGLYTLGAMDIFSRLQQEQFCHLNAYLSFYEIYCTKLYDLLNKRSQLVLRQDGKSNINVVGLSEIPVSSVQQFENHLKIGSSQRVTSQNSANSQSSRSHAILQITLKNGKKTFGKVYFIDLAGNQRGADHMNMKKQTQKDGQQINKSLLQLKQCIRGLDQGKNHVPFRGSKLTMCLKDSFIGFCRTVMIGNLSPSSSSSENTLNTLRYADRVKQLKNSEDLSKQQLKSRQMMLPRQNKNAIKIAISNSDDEEDIAEKKRIAMNNYGVKVEQPITNSPSTNLKQRNSSTARDAELMGRKHSIGGGTSMKNNISQNQQPVKGSSIAKNNGVSNQIGANKKISSVAITKKEENEYANKNGLNLNLSQHSQMMQSSIQQRTREDGTERSAGNSMDMRKNNNYMRSGNGVSGNAGNLTSRSNTGGNVGLSSQHREYQGPGRNNFATNSAVNLDYGLANGGSINQQNMNGRGINNRPTSSSNHQAPMMNQFQQPQSQYRQQQPISPMPKNPLHKANNFFSNNSAINSNNSYIQQQGPSPINGMNNYYSSTGNNYPTKQTQNQQYQTPNQQILSHHPESWNQLVSSIENESLSVETRQEYNMLLNQNLLESENELISQHSNTLQSQIQKIKEEMETIKVIEQDRTQITSKQYAQLMYESIDQKMSQLEMLKQTLTTFMYKLDDMEEVERKIEMLNSTYRVKNHNEDEQLLDDFD